MPFGSLKTKKFQRFPHLADFGRISRPRFAGPVAARRNVPTGTSPCVKQRWTGKRRAVRVQDPSAAVLNGVGVPVRTAYADKAAPFTMS